MNKQNFRLIFEAKEVAGVEDKEITPGFDFDIYWGDDGTPVIEIGTKGLACDPDKQPVCRVWLNDATIYENPPVPTFKAPMKRTINPRAGYRSSNG
jgi:hypothetical protein